MDENEEKELRDYAAALFGKRAPEVEVEFSDPEQPQKTGPVVPREGTNPTARPKPDTFTPEWAADFFKP